jgi:Peptidase family M1 domain
VTSMTRMAAAAGLLLLCSAALAQDATALLNRYEHLTLGAPVAVSNLSIANGAMKISLAEGQAAPVKAGDEVIGLFFKGSGSFDYAADAVELPIAKTNLRNTKSKVTVSGSTIHVNFNDALIAAKNVKLPELTGAAGGALDEAFAENRKVFDNDRSSHLVPRMIEQQLAAPATPLVRADLRGDEEWVYTADREDERLARLYTIDFEDRARRVERYEADIAARPVGRTRNDPRPHDALITNIDYTLVAAEDRDVTATVAETIVPRVDGMHGLTFALVSKLYPEDGKPARHYDVKSVTTADGAAVPFARGDGWLSVTLPQPTSAAVPVKLTFSLAGDIIFRPSRDNYWLLEDWYPSLGLYGVAATAHGVVKVKAPFVPMAGGKTIARKTEGDYNVVESRLDEPTLIVAITAGKYWSEEETRGNRTIRASSYGQKNPRAAKKLVALAFDMIGYYEYFLGPFPLDELNIVEMNDFGWGHSPAGMIFITSEAFQPLLGDENQEYSKGVNQRFAHEIAHQYWGNAVRWSGPEEEWICEAFAEYSSALLMKKFKGDGPYSDLLAHWKADARESGALAPIPFANRIVTPNNVDWNRYKLIYGKGPLLLAALNKQVGDETFLTFLKSYQKSFHNKVGTTRDVAGLLGFMTKKDFKPFFEQYYWGTDIPDVK